MLRSIYGGLVLRVTLRANSLTLYSFLCQGKLRLMRWVLSNASSSLLAVFVSRRFLPLRFAAFDGG